MELNSSENSNMSCEIMTHSLEQFAEKSNPGVQVVDLDSSIHTSLKLSTMASRDAENSKIRLSECGSMNKDELIIASTSLSGIGVDLESSNGADRLELLSSTDPINEITGENILSDRSHVSVLEFDMGGTDLIAHSDLCLGSDPLDSVPVLDTCSLKETFHENNMDKDQSIGMTFSHSFISDNEAKTCDSTLDTCTANNNVPVSLPTIQLLPLECQNIQILTPVSNAVVRSLQLPLDTNQTTLRGTPPAQGAVLSSAVLFGNMVMLTRGWSTVQNSVISTLAGMPNKALGTGNLLLKSPIKLQVVSAKQLLDSSTALKSITATDCDSPAANNAILSYMPLVANTSERFGVSVTQKEFNVKRDTVSTCSSAIPTPVCSHSLLPLSSDSNLNHTETKSCLLNNELVNDSSCRELTAESNTLTHVSSDQQIVIGQKQLEKPAEFIVTQKDDSLKKVVAAPSSTYPVDVSNKFSASKLKKQENRLQSKSNEKEQYNCDLCSAVFSRLGNFTRHRMTHTVSAKDDYRYKCDECGRLFLQRCDMRRHMLIHSKQEPYHCQDCGKGYIRKSDLVVHMRFHKKDRPFKCQSCSKSFYQSGDLNRHMRNVHLHSRTVMCGHCNRSFAKEATLIRHMQTTHRTIILQSLNISPEQTSS